MSPIEIPGWLGLELKLFNSNSAVSAVIKIKTMLALIILNIFPHCYDDDDVKEVQI